LCAAQIGQTTKPALAELGNPWHSRLMTTSAPSHRLAYVLLVLTALFWSGNFVLARAMHAAVPPMTLSFMRWLIAFALLAPFSLRHAWRERALLWQCRGRILALSLLGISQRMKESVIGGTAACMERARTKLPDQNSAVSTSST
jgi:hypothetical protein